MISIYRGDSSRLAMGTAGKNHANRTGVFASVALAGSESGVYVMVVVPNKVKFSPSNCVWHMRDWNPIRTCSNMGHAF